MAARTTTKSGVWSDPTTWSPSGVPASGDSVTIGHALTLDSSFSGIAAWTQNANVVTSGTGLTFGFAANTLIALTTSGVTWTIGAGNNVAGTPGSPAVCTIGAVASGSPGNSAIVFNGTSSAPCASSDVRYTYDGTHAGGGVIRATWTTFTRAGDATHNAINTYQNGNTANPVTLSDCTFDNCGTVTHVGSLLGADTWDFRRCVWKNTAAGVAPMFASGYLSPRTAGVGVRNIVSCVFDGTPSFTTPLGFTFQYDWFWTSLLLGGTGAWDLFDSCVIRKDDATAVNVLPMQGAYSNCYWLTDSAPVAGGGASPHVCQVNGALSGSFVLDGNVSQLTRWAGGKWFITSGSPPSATTYKFTRNLIIPPSQVTGGAGTVLLNAGAQAGITTTYEHNTVYNPPGGYGVISPGETAAEVAGFIGSYAANIAWGPSGANVLHMLDTGHFSSSAGVVTDMASPSVIRNNVGFNVADHYTQVGSPVAWYTNQANGYSMAFSSTPGTSDLGRNVDPQFVDATRNIETWDGTLGGPGTIDPAAIAHVLARLQLRDANYTVPALLAHVRAGFAPRNATLRNASYAGDPLSADVGAVPVSTGIPPTTCTLAWPSVVDIGFAATITATLDQPATATTTVTPTVSGVPGTLAGSPITIAAGAASGSCTFTASGTGTATLAASTSPTLAVVAPSSRVVTAFGTYLPTFVTNANQPPTSVIRRDYRSLAMPAPLASPDAGNHYDPPEVFESLRRFTGDSTYDVEIGVAAYQMFELFWLPACGGVAGHSNYTVGLRDYWHRTGDERARVALHLNSYNGLNSKDAANFSTDQSASRETAYAAQSLMDDEDCGCAHRARLDRGGGQQSYVNVMLGHCAQWLVPEGSRDPCWYIQPFMVGLTLRTLINYWDRYRDTTAGNFANLNSGNLTGLTTIPQVIRAVLDLLWTGGHQGPTAAARTPFWFPDQHAPGFGITNLQNAFGPAGTGAFTYRNPFQGDQPSTCYPPGFSDGGNYPTCTLSLLISPAYHWFYQQSGLDAYRQRADAIFAGSMASVANSFNPASGPAPQKEYHQCYLWSIDGLAWRARGAAPPAAATALTLAGPDPATDHRAVVPSDRFVVALAGGATGPVTITPTDRGAGGRFLPASVVLTTDRAVRAFRYIPPASKANSLVAIGITASDPALALPSDVAYTVGPAATVATGYIATPPATANGPNQYSPDWTVALVPPGSVPGATADAQGGIVLAYLFDGSFPGAMLPDPYVWLTAATPTATCQYFPNGSGTRPLSLWTDPGSAAVAGPFNYTPAASDLPGGYTVSAPSPASGPAGSPATLVVAATAGLSSDGAHDGIGSGAATAVVVTIADAAGGATAPATATLYGIHRTATLAYTPTGSPGARTLAPTNAIIGQRLTDPPAVAYTVTGSVAARGLLQIYIAGGGVLPIAVGP